LNRQTGGGASGDEGRKGGAQSERREEGRGVHGDEMRMDTKKRRKERSKLNTALSSGSYSFM
jgi:hypothetical protein